MSGSYETFEVSRPEGVLRVGRWGRGSTYVLAAHGVTANHVSFRALAEQLPQDVTLLAPDLRGRGGSNGIAGPYGMPAHADDLAAILDHAGVPSATLVGHSMGGFVVLVAADRHPDRVDGVVLVDGGLPLDLGPLADLPIDQLVAAIIGPALERLRTTYASVEDYLDFWRVHPALSDYWSDDIEAYVRYDLVGTPPQLRSGVREEAVLADSESDLREGVVEAALQNLRHPTVLLRAERGLTDADPLYAEETVARWQRAVPGLVVRTVPDVNHYTIALSKTGATAIAEAVAGLS